MANAPWIRWRPGKDPASKPLAAEYRFLEIHEWHTDFERHTSTKVWDDGYGRIGIKPECSAKAPAFEIGPGYLLIVGADQDVKTAEDDTRPGEKWLQYIYKNTRHQ